ncbi:MAG: hypothetical protein CVU71_03465 [Deltaproteobacteria bacterium HGW-Deltaproteobacteria-6]|jgi:hypothetical protein|nr:MAG: hypothetical protein CVU71_03465 [Deltaproteobacteria bacterium HGW-Deltaproteobacteria-6]
MDVNAIQSNTQYPKAEQNQKVQQQQPQQQPQQVAERPKEEPAVKQQEKPKGPGLINTFA